KSEKIKKKLKLLEGFNYYSFLFDFPQISLGTTALLEDLLQQQYDEKNIRRRVYDALNVLMKQIEKKAAYLQELEEQFVGLQNLIQRNQELCASGNVITGGVSLPFILVQICPHATVEVEISEDMQLVHFDFNRYMNMTDLQNIHFLFLHDDNCVLNLMNLCGRPESDDANCDLIPNATPHILIPNVMGTSSSTIGPTSPPLQLILKARVKQSTDPYATGYLFQ
ncbi:hypothetical protein MKW92_043036, partial [Papaver armeniacum]